MPTLDELREAARIQARRAFDTRQEETAKETRQLDERVKNEPVRESQPSGNETVISLPEARIKPFPSKDEQKRKARGVMRAADDLARTAVGPLGNLLESIMPIARVDNAFSDDLNAVPSITPSSTLPESHALTEGAKERTTERFGSGVTTGTEIGGVVGQALALPNSLMSSPYRAGGTSGALTGSDTVLERMSLGKPLTTQEGVSDIATDTAVGTFFGFGGYHIGQAFSKLVGRLAGKDGSLGKIAAKHIQTEREVVNRSSNSMKASGVVIGKGSFAHFVNSLQKDLEKLPFDKNISKQGWKAFNTLRSQTGRGRLQDMDLTRFNEYRKAIRDSIRSAQTGLLKPSVSNNDMIVIHTITNKMNDFIESLPGKASTVGDASAGVAAWRNMNKYHQKVAKANIIADFIMNAESHALRGTKDIVVALQDEFQSLFSTPAGRELLNQEFPEKAMQSVLSELAHGNFSQQILTKMDRMMGSTLFSPVFRAVKAGTNVAGAAEGMRRQALEAIGKTLQSPMSPPMSGQMGAAAALGAGSAIPQSQPSISMPPYQGQLPQMPPGMPPLQNKMQPTPSKIPPQQGAGLGTTSPNVSPDPLKAVNPPRRP